jgi:hypothetical protein
MWSGLQLSLQRIHKIHSSDSSSLTPVLHVVIHNLQVVAAQRGTEHLQRVLLGLLSTENASARETSLWNNAVVRTVATATLLFTAGSHESRSAHTDSGPTRSATMRHKHSAVQDHIWPAVKYTYH